MGAILVLSNGKKLDIDRAFVDQGKPPVMGMMGGQKTIFEKGTPPKCSIYQRGESFFTLDGAAMTAKIAEPWLDDADFPEDLKALFRKFLAKIEAGKAPKEKPTKIRPKKPVSRKVDFAPEDAGLSSTRAERVV